jgi:hypothetical protein
MRAAFIIVLSLIVLPVFASKEELLVLCKGIETDLLSLNPLKINYTMTVTGNSDQPGTESINGELLKYGSNYRLTFGDLKVVLRKGETVVMVDHHSRLMAMEKDTSKLSAAQVFSMDITSLVNRASSVTKKVENGLNTFTCYFSNGSEFNKIVFGFTAKSKIVQSIYCEYPYSKSQPVYSVNIRYSTWDRNWKPLPSFPELETYVIKSGASYRPAAAYATYQFYPLTSNRVK